MAIQYLKNFYRNNSWKLLLSFLFLLFALFILFVITDEVVLEKEESVDLFIFQFLRDHIVSGSVTGFMSAVTQFSSTIFIRIIFPLLIVSLLIFKMYRKAIFLFAAGIGGLLLIYGMKIFFQRPRPPYPLLHKEENFSFPSGHATFSFVFYGAMAYFIWLTDLPKMWKYVAMIFLVALSMMIGFSRVYLRVHYPSDVMGGFCLGYSWLFLMIFAFRKWYPLN